LSANNSFTDLTCSKHACLPVKPAIPVSGKFKVLHGFESVLAALFSFWAHFHAALAAQKPRFAGLRAFALRPRRPLRGRRVLLRNPYNRLRYLKASLAVKVDADFRFEIGIPAVKLTSLAVFDNLMKRF
jgi:hypothetical protein